MDETDTTIFSCANPTTIFEVLLIIHLHESHDLPSHWFLTCKLFQSRLRLILYVELHDEADELVGQLVSLDALVEGKPRRRVKSPLFETYYMGISVRNFDLFSFENRNDLQAVSSGFKTSSPLGQKMLFISRWVAGIARRCKICLLYTSDAADE